jgi:hypothetical protein
MLVLVQPTLALIMALILIFVDCFQMNLAGEFSLICHLEILHQMFLLILLLVLQMMAAWAKETARLIFTEGFSIYERSKWIKQKTFDWHCLNIFFSEYLLPILSSG